MVGLAGDRAMTWQRAAAVFVELRYLDQHGHLPASSCMIQAGWLQVPGALASGRLRRAWHDCRTFGRLAVRPQRRDRVERHRHEKRFVTARPLAFNETNLDSTSSGFQAQAQRSRRSVLRRRQWAQHEEQGLALLSRQVQSAQAFVAVNDKKFVTNRIKSSLIY